jgi:hypothetical protein
MFTVLVDGNKHSDPNMPIRVSDTDQATGSYFGLAFLYLATADHNPVADDLFARPFVGGLDVTGSDRTYPAQCHRDVCRAVGGRRRMDGKQ